ncbi:alpha/beta fold hydrolase [Kineosporia sp. J2-2]|uniref:Alpha/beta fold hydrolase n=1 Tax=Kineosporia corallincola TaxID=2835133 RepID=A0ABS5TI56_9ACTN|nr:alpha/beta fold hydrolase [Kineosporia corallincola]MBT0770725.1 alpha/beta fold hydrolase [Kineosporia corallincola]
MPVFTHDDTQTEYEAHGDPEGRPVLVHHGLVGSAGLAPVWHELAVRAGLRLVSVARPGYGRSTPVPMTSIADWAGLVTPLLDELDVDRFGVLGVSAGAPYAYALAATMPERVRRVAVLSGTGRVDEPETRALYPDEARHRLESFATSSPEQVRAFWHGNIAMGLALNPAEHPMRRPLTDTAAHGAAGPARESVNQLRDWGFALESVTTPVSLWHSRADEQVPYAAAEIVAGRIPGAVLHEQAEAGHLPSMASAVGAVEFLAS